MLTFSTLKAKLSRLQTCGIIFINVKGQEYKYTITSPSIGERQACANTVNPDQTLHNVTSNQV